MTYLAKEESREDGQPIELFLFEGVEAQFSYTSGQEEVIFNGRTYVPKAIKRGSPEVESLQSDRSLVLTLPANDPFVLRYVPTLPSSVDKITIFRFHSTDGGTPEVVTFFVGDVSSVGFKGNKADVSIISQGRVLDDPTPRQTCRAPCNHILYDSRCAVVDSLFRITVTVTAISADGVTITVDGGTNTIPDTGLQLSAQITALADFFNGGFLRRSGIEHRMTLTTVDNGGNSADFTILIPFAQLSVGTVLDLFAGCDHQIATCTAKFANTPRYGGFPFVPLKNPFGIDITS